MTRAAMAIPAVLCALVAWPGCEGRGREGEGEGEGEGEAAFLEVLDEEADLGALADDGAAIKYLAPVEGVAPRAPVGERCLFQNMRRESFHLPFLRSLPGGEDIDFADYQDLVLLRATRAWWGGEVRLLPEQTHPLTGTPGVFAWTLYTNDSPGNRLVIDDIRAGFVVMQRCAPAFLARAAFVPSSTEQRVTAGAARAGLHAEGIAVFLP